MLKANVKFGSVPVQIEAETLKELIQEASFFADVPTECQCGSHNLVPRHRNVDDNDFYEIQCQDCLHTMRLGQYKKENGAGLFVKKSEGWHEPYRKQQSE